MVVMWNDSNENINWKKASLATTPGLQYLTQAGRFLSHAWNLSNSSVHPLAGHELMKVFPSFPNIPFFPDVVWIVRLCKKKKSVLNWNISKILVKDYWRSITGLNQKEVNGRIEFTISIIPSRDKNDKCAILIFFIFHSLYPLSGPLHGKAQEPSIVYPTQG